MPTGIGSYLSLLVEGLQLVERELLLFALFWFVVGMADEMAVDLLWLALRLFRRHRTSVLQPERVDTLAAGPLAVFIPAWQEAQVIGATVSHMLRVWPESGWRLYVGCYGNDPATIAAARAAGDDPRLNVVIHERAGPTTKADCLNRLYAALCDDEARLARRFRGVVLHDAEDMVHPRELHLIGRALDSAEFVQLPVRPEFPPGPRWVSGHYCDEFSEAHAKTLVVRGALGAGLPSAGVGCGFHRDMLERIGEMRRIRREAGPFAADCLTEDYELGLLIERLGGRSRFLRLRDAEGQLVATRSYFPTAMADSVRQKTRWIHGICLQGWDRLGWTGRPAGIWMALRDRRGPLTALVLAVAYALVVLEGVLALLRPFVPVPPPPGSPLLETVLRICMIGLLWRAFMRFVFTAREYGLAEGLFAIARIPIANFITIIAGRRAFTAYWRSLRGARIVWDKTEHSQHPVQILAAEGTE